jgi:hypothetical protein
MKSPQLAVVTTFYPYLQLTPASPSCSISHRSPLELL